MSINVICDEFLMLKRNPLSMLLVLLGVCVPSVLAAGPAAAADNDIAAMKNVVEAKVMPFLSDPVVTSAIKAQNDKHASLKQADIDKLDKGWRRK